MIAVSKITTPKKTGRKKLGAETIEPKTEASKERYFEAVGRRKTSIARVRIWLVKQNNGSVPEVTVNGKSISNYFVWPEYQEIVLAPLHKTSDFNWRISVKVKGGGLHAQAVATRHGLSRVLILANPESRKVLKTAGFLTRDPRMKERKKFGLKGARRAPQWSKR